MNRRQLPVEVAVRRCRRRSAARAEQNQPRYHFHRTPHGSPPLIDDDNDKEGPIGALFKRPCPAPLACFYAIPLAWWYLDFRADTASAESSWLAAWRHRWHAANILSSTRWRRARRAEISARLNGNDRSLPGTDPIERAQSMFFGGIQQ
jgi:hypothetical protein